MSPPRKVWAARTLRTLSASCGSTVTDTTSALPTSYNAGGTDRSSRFGLARALAEPTQMTIAARRSPSYSPDNSDSCVTGPNRRSPKVQCGKGISGSWIRTWPPSPPPSRIRKSTRITTIATPSHR